MARAALRGGVFRGAALAAVVAAVAMQGGVAAHGQGLFGEVQSLGGQVSDGFKHAGGEVSDTFKRGVGAVEDAAARNDPTSALLREYKTEQAEALRRLNKLDLNTTIEHIEAALQLRLDRVLARSGATFNLQTGDLDLRGTAMGRTLRSWLFSLAQGNLREAAVQELRFNTRSQTLFVRLYVRHRQSWGRVIPGRGPIDLYSVSQYATITFDFNNGSGGFTLNLGPLAPAISSGALRQLQSGDLLGFAEAAVPEAVGDLARLETSDDLDEVESSYYARYGQGNVYFPSRGFASFATPERLARYVVNGVVSLGTDVWPEIMNDLGDQARAELPALVQWLASRGLGDAEGIAAQLISGRVPEMPALSFRMLAVPFRSRNGTPVGVATPWRTVNHVTFAVIWHSPQHAAMPSVLQTVGQVVQGVPGDSAALEEERRQRLALLEQQQEIQRLRMAAGPATIAPPPSGLDPAAGNNAGAELNAANLGITYLPVQFGDGTFGARLTRYPAPNSPAAQLGLEPGDIVTELDGTPFRTPQDVLNHRQDTTVRLINVRTNSPLDARVFIP
jgi:hypothetical protein